MPPTVSKRDAETYQQRYAAPNDNGEATIHRHCKTCDLSTGSRRSSLGSLVRQVSSERGVHGLTDCFDAEKECSEGCRQSAQSKAQRVP